MKKYILTTVATLLCTLVLFSMSIAPAQAYAPPDDEGGAITYAETVRWYFRMNNGVKEMRLWSITDGRWLTDWVPCPVQP